MQNEELYEEIESEQSFTEKYFGLSLVKFVLIFTIIVAFAAYLSNIFYGTNSLEILLGLQDYETYLQNEVQRLKHENAELQREYFELKEISAK